MGLQYPSSVAHRVPGLYNPSLPKINGSQTRPYPCLISEYFLVSVDHFGRAWNLRHVLGLYCYWLQEVYYRAVRELFVGTKPDLRSRLNINWVTRKMIPGQAGSIDLQGPSSISFAESGSEAAAIALKNALSPNRTSRGLTSSGPNAFAEFRTKSCANAFIAVFESSSTADG